MGWSGRATARSAADADKRHQRRGTCRAYAVSTVVGGLIAYPRAAAGKVLRGYRDFMGTVGEDLTVYA